MDVCYLPMKFSEEALHRCSYKKVLCSKKNVANLQERTSMPKYDFNKVAL